MRVSGSPRQPFVGLALAAVLGIVVADYFALSPSILIASAALAIVCALVLLRGPVLFLTYLLVACGFSILHGFQTNGTPGLSLASRLGDRPRVLSANGQVITEPRVTSNGFASFQLKLSSIELEGKQEPTNATILARWPGNPKFGDELKLFGLAETIDPPRNPGEFDLRSYLTRQDVHRSLFARYEEQGVIAHRAGGNSILQAAQKSRTWLQQALSRGLESDPEIRGLIEGISLGIRSDAPNDVEELFQQTGTFHLFAVSGLNVAIVAHLLWVLGILVRLPRRWTVALIIPALGFYAAVTGLQTSCVRAAVMGSVLLAGFFVERKVWVLNSLAAAAFFILAWNTQELFSVGFQLSFAVVLAILLWAEPIFQFFRRWGAPDPFLPRSLLSGPRKLLDTSFGWLCRGASVSLAAWLGSLPLIYWNFHLVTPISLFANIVVVPIAFFILAIAMISILCAPFLGWLTIIFNHANWVLAHLLLGAVNLFAQFPGGHFYLERPHPPRGEVQMTVLDAGAGAAVHLRAHGVDWLFDCGPQRDYEDQLREYLHARGINRLDGLWLTHGDSLHIGAAAAVIEDFSPKTLLDNPALDRSSVHRRLRTSFKQIGIYPTTAVTGDKVALSRGVTANVLFPPSGFTSAKGDDQTFVIQLVLASSNTRILLVFDSGGLTEQALLDARADLRSDILIKGQHHSGASGSAAFLDAVQPRLIIATSRDFPDSERVNDQWAAEILARGIKLFRQDETGAVELQFEPRSWQARSYFTGEIFRSSSR